MKYKVYLEGKPSSQHELIESSNYVTDSEFVNFYINILGENVNVASFRSEYVISVILEKETIQEKRQKKLKRVLKDNMFKKFLRKIF